jgi:hypothetical protein
MTNPNADIYEHQTNETKFLFKHLLLFLLVTMVVKFWNMAMFSNIPWSGIIIFIWTVILGLHLLLFFLSTGILGKDYENVPVKVIAKQLINMIKERNTHFRKSIGKQVPEKTTP